MFEICLSLPNVKIFKVLKLIKLDFAAYKLVFHCGG